MLFSLLTLPFTGPVKALAAISRVVLEEAERGLYDEASIRQALQKLEIAYDAGRLSDEELEQQEEQLLERLKEARRRQRERLEAQE